jgi:ERCC4-related helicase
MHVNPWTSFPRLITSMDFLKREQPLRLFQESLQHKESPLRDWDLLVVDEAHNVAPSGRGQYAVASDRTRMLSAIIDHFEHRLFLTATPHNGFTESFTALLDLLAPLRFSRGPDVNREQVKAVMVRRLKENITTSLGARKFAERRVEAIQVALSARERRLHQLLDDYTASRLHGQDRTNVLPLQFALTMLKKRLLSSPRAFAHSLNTHLTTLGAIRESEPDLTLVERMAQRVNEDWANDVEKSQREDDALVESSRFFMELTREDRSQLEEMRRLSEPAAQPDGKAEALVDWIDRPLCPNGTWTDERLIVFTEYKDTLDYLTAILAERYGQARLLTLFGGMNLSERELIKAAFQADPAEHPVRILVATDAASEVEPPEPLPQPDSLRDSLEPQPHGTA